VICVGSLLPLHILIWHTSYLQHHRGQDQTHYLQTSRFFRSVIVQWIRGISPNIILYYFLIIQLCRLDSTPADGDVRDVKLSSSSRTINIELPIPICKHELHGSHKSQSANTMHQCPHSLHTVSLWSERATPDVLEVQPNPSQFTCHFTTSWRDQSYQRWIPSLSLPPG